ncbi:retron St85 family effector protein [Erwinia billingiae]|uniref:retron St85 family effector protein n=1 Tax=Erwinia billingiae TaxID=182337 RepID=UPI0030CEA69E
MTKSKILPLFKNITENQLNLIVIDIIDLIKNGTDYTKKIIFLCGKDKSDKNSYRYLVSNILIKEKNFQLAYPEDLFEDLLEGQANNSLLKLEEQLAEAVDLIVIIPESPGSFAELGAFAMREELARKMLVLRQSKYKSDKSFINHGPIRLVRAAKGRVLEMSNNLDISNADHTDPIMKQVKRMLSSSKRSKSLDNILMYHSHILLLIYLFDDITNANAAKILAKILNRKLVTQDYNACRAALHSLIRSSLIDKIGDIYRINHNGFSEINSRYYAISELNNLRIKIMNKQLSGQ